MCSVQDVDIDVDGRKVGARQGGPAEPRQVVCAGYSIGQVGREQVSGGRRSVAMMWLATALFGGKMRLP